MNAPTPATVTSAPPSESSRAPRLSPAELKALKPHVITLTDGRLDREATPDPTSAVNFATVEADIDAIFKTHLPAFIKKQAGGTVPIVLYAHGGLVKEEDGFAAASLQVDWWKANGVYPIHFVWKTGLMSAIVDAIGRYVTGGARGFDDIKDRAIEEGARLLGGEHIWGDMKLDAAASSDGSGGARVFAQKLAAWMKSNPDAVKVHAVGHSAGSIFHSHLIPVALDAGVPRFQTVSFLAPAVRIDTFKSKLLPRAKQIGNLAVFTMTEQAELDDTCFNVYGKSLLYLVRASFEPARGTPILGLAASIKDDDDVRGFLDGPGGEVIYSPNRKPIPEASKATTHGGFDDDGPTMDSVLVRVTGLAKPKQPFPAGSRSIEAWPDAGPTPDAPRGVGGKMALCIGIDDYKRAGDRLKGCVRDAELWGDVLGAAGFGVTLLTNRDATRNGILGSIFRMINNSTTGDTLVVQYSGHGTFAPDLNGDEDDRQDEAICPVDFRDGQLILDDDLGGLWNLIPEGVSLTIFFDSCHSGGANRGVGPEGESIPRGVELTTEDVNKFRIARGAAAPNGKKQALEDVVASESPAAPAMDEPARKAEVLFAACKPTQLAWETNGQGDFTKFVAPLIAQNIGRVSNRQFFDTITAGFDAHRQEPTFEAARHADAPLLAAHLDGEQPTKPVENGKPVVAKAKGVGRDAAIAAILRGVADLLES
ncbi:MAG: caspase family protein [Microbacterium sp.]